MKRYLNLLIITFALSSFTISLGINEVIMALRSGNAAQLSQYFDNTIDITMPDKSNAYSKSQAEMVLRDFFMTNGVQRFDVIHKGENTGSQYCIGTLVTRSGSYRTTIYMKQRGDKQVIQEIRLEKR